MPFISLVSVQSPGTLKVIKRSPPGWPADFFHSSLSTPFSFIVGGVCVVYTATFFLFGTTWWGELE